MAKTKHVRGVYDEQKLVDAVREVKSGKMTSIEASKSYKVPGSTIRSHVVKASLKIGAGRHSYLNLEQETYLVELIKSFGPMGVRLTKPILNKIAGEFIEGVTNIRLKSTDYSMRIIYQFFSFRTTAEPALVVQFFESK